MSKWQELVDKVRNLTRTIDIGLVGKYVELPDAYLSVVESLKHAGIDFDANIAIHWINSEELDKETIKTALSHVAGFIVPGGFGSRRINGKIDAIQYELELTILFLGITLGRIFSLVEHS